MIPCNEKCQLYFRCEFASRRPRCIFDMGIYVEEEDEDEFLEKITYWNKNKIMMVSKDKEMQDFFRKKLRIALLGESSLMTHNQVSELCMKFFEYGIEYAKKS